MSTGIGKCRKIRHIVKLKQMLRRWRQKAAAASRLTGGPTTRVPSDIPAGHVAVIVGTSCRRFVVRATHLNHPVIKKLLIQTEEEFGFSNHHGPLSIPCDESVFEEIIRYISRPESNKFVNLEDFQRYCHVGLRQSFEFWTESRPLLHNGLSEKSIW